MSVLVIGYGNPLRSDDGAGWLAAQRLADEPADGVEVLTSQQLTPEMAEPVSRAAAVIFIDASYGGTPGRVACRPVGPAAGSGPSLTHHLSPETLLASARILYGRCPVGTVVSVSGEAFGHGDTLSEPVATAMPRVIDSVRAIISRFTTDPAGGARHA